MAKTTGCLLTKPNGEKYWVPAPDAKSGFEWMAASQADARTYGDAWDDPATVIEFGTDDGKVFVAAERIRPLPEEGAS